MTSYTATFRRHRRLLSIPMALAVLAALWFVLGSPKAYESTATLWVDNAPPATSSLTDANPAIQTPAEQEQLLIQELLQSKSFRLAVGHGSALAAYLARDPGQGWGPQALFSSVSGGDGSINSRILSAVSAKKVQLTVAGPQVIQLRYRAGTPQVAAGTLAAFLRQLDRQRHQLNLLRSRSTLAYYEAQVAAAGRAVVSARQRTQAYLRAHPGATAAGDPNLKALKRGEIAATSQLAQATARVNRSSSRVDAGVPGGSAFEVLDQPKVPSAPVSRIKAILLALVGGLFAGALISFLGVVALTRGRQDPFEDPIPEAAHGRPPDIAGAESDLVLHGETGYRTWEQPPGMNGG